MAQAKFIRFQFHTIPISKFVNELDKNNQDLLIDIQENQDTDQIINFLRTIFPHLPNFQVYFTSENDNLPITMNEDEYYLLFNQPFNELNITTELTNFSVWA